MSSQVHDQHMVVAQAQQKLSPLTILLLRFLVKSLSTSIDTGQVAVQSWLKSHDMAIVEFNDPKGFVNINSRKETDVHPNDCR